MWGDDSTALGTHDYDGRTARKVALSATLSSELSDNPFRGNHCKNGDYAKIS